MQSLEFLIWLEQFRSGVGDAFMVAVTSLGDERTYLALLAIIYLCVDRQFGFRVLVMFLLSAYCNEQLKWLVGTTRPYKAFPYELDPIYPDSGPGYSFPSGHSQNAAAVWGTLALGVRSWWARAGMVVLILLIGFSRLYLGVHWPVDVVGGLLIGAFLVAFVALAIRGGGLHPARWQWALISVGLGVATFAAGFPRYGCVSASGAFLGAALGYLLCLGSDYRARAPLGIQVAKAGIALAALFALRVAGKALLGEGPWAMGGLHVALGFVATCALPMFFVAVGWARVDSAPPEDPPE